MVNSRWPKLFDCSIRIVPRTRACKFSKATPVSGEPNADSNPAVNLSTSSATGWWVNVMPRLRHRISESLIEPSDENREGMVIAATFSGPKASTASANVSAESMPPEEPTTACLNPQRRA